MRYTPKIATIALGLALSLPLYGCTPPLGYQIINDSNNSITVRIPDAKGIEKVIALGAGMSSSTTFLPPAKVGWTITSGPCVYTYRGPDWRYDGAVLTDAEKTDLRRVYDAGVGPNDPTLKLIFTSSAIIKAYPNNQTTFAEADVDVAGFPMSPAERCS